MAILFRLLRHPELVRTVKLAILIAIETYNDSNIHAIPFALENAQALSNTFESLGFELTDQILLLQEQATKAAIESKVRRALKSCLEEDQVIIYFSGHAFSVHGKNYFACADSDWADLQHTTVGLNWLFQQFNDSDCQQVILMTDSGEKELAVDRENVQCDSFATQELSRLVEANDRCVCFTACSPEEHAHVSRKWKQGLWVHHIVEALQGKVPSILQQGSELTCGALQEFLKRSVSQSLTTHFISKSTQTPCVFGVKAESMILADLSDIFEAKRAGATPYADLINNVTFLASRTSSVRSLSGFKKGNSIPDRANMAAQSFVVQLAQEQISQDLKSVFAALKSAFKFKRADVAVTDQGDGTGTITTPYFNYSISVEIDPSNPSQVVWRRNVDAIRKPEEIFSDAFASVFASVFDSVEFTTPEPIDLYQLIDAVEDLEDERIEMEYDPGGTECIMSIVGITGEIHVTKQSLKIVHERAEAPNYLLRSFFSIQSTLVGSDGTTLIPIGSRR